MKRAAVGCLSTLCVLVLLCSGLLLMPSWARRSLPWNATDIREHYEDARFGSDFKRFLKQGLTNKTSMPSPSRLNSPKNMIPLGIQT